MFLPNPVVVPGGRFREIYYWDSFWIIKGLLACGMKNTAKGMVENLLHFVDILGYVPNGGRVYYTRSQPPLLAAMVDACMVSSEDKEWAISKVELLEKEWNYWEREHSIVVEGKKMFRYYCKEATPRPESYREDFTLVENLDPKEQEKVWRELRTGAESGWDYSSRWFNQAGDGTDLKETRISSIVPVDLNSFLVKSAEVIEKIHRMTQELIVKNNTK